MIGNRRGTTTLIETIMVCTLIALLAPLVIGILQESQDRLSPTGRYGRRIRTAQNASTLLGMIQTDLDRTRALPPRSAAYSTDRGDLILDQESRRVIYHPDGSRLWRVELDLAGRELRRQMVQRDLGRIRFTLDRCGTLGIALECRAAVPGAGPLILRTTLSPPSNRKPGGFANRAGSAP